MTCLQCDQCTDYFFRRLKLPTKLYSTGGNFSQNHMLTPGNYLFTFLGDYNQVLSHYHSSFYSVSFCSIYTGVTTTPGGVAARCGDLM